MFDIIKNYHKALFILFLISFFIFHVDILNVAPAPHHSWANFDRYALAKGFQRNQFNFFLPETYAMNPLFKGNLERPINSSITAVDFPIHEYVVGLLMELSSFSGFWIYRLYILIWSFIGLLFLFKLCVLITFSSAKAFVVTLYAALSPVFVYYQSSFLPTIPSLSCLIISLYYYWRFFKQVDAKVFSLLLFFLTLAALPRISFLPAILTIIGFDILINRSTDIKWSRRLFGFSIPIVIVAVYYLYNSYLKNQFGSIFLSSFQGVDNISDFLKCVQQVFINFGLIYFSWWQYLIIFGLIIYYCSNYNFKRFSFKTIDQFSLLIVLLLLQACLVLIVMIKQFVYHDYYFLDTFFIPMLLLIAIVLKSIPEIVGKYSMTSILIIAIIPAFWFAKINANSKFEFNPEDKHHIALKAFEGSEKFLNSFGISNSAKILVIDAYAPNMALGLMNRKGFSLMTTTHESIAEAVKWDYDYVAVANELFITELYNYYPEFLNEFEKIADNRRISIYKRDVNKRVKILSEFIGASEIKNKLNISFNYDHLKNQDNVSNEFGTWNNFIIDTISDNPRLVISMNKNLEYGLTFKTKSCAILKEKNCILQIQTEMKLKEIGDAEIVVSLDERGQMKNYQAKKLKDLVHLSEEWTKIELIFNIPRVIEEDYTLNIYLWNKKSIEGFIRKFDAYLY